MRTFVQKQNQTQKPASSRPARANRATVGPNHRDPILHLQHTIGNQSVQRVLQTHTEEPEVRSTAAPSSGFGHDFSLIPIHAPVAIAIQTSLVVNKPGDEYEKEADRVAERVMHIPTPRLQRACSCGGSCSDCRRDLDHEELHMKSAGAAGVAQQAALPIVQEVLRTPGQPLDATTRTFMEARFERDFSHVRVHADSRAERSAHAVHARAYTVGQHIVFGAGEYAGHSHAGRTLLAHELTHTIQQRGVNGGMLHRDPQPETDVYEDTPKRTLQEYARKVEMTSKGSSRAHGFPAGLNSP